MVIVIALVTHPTKPLYGQGASAEIDSTELSVEYRSPSCIGCPEYRVSFRGIGSFEAACFGGCAVPGSHGGKFPRPEFLRLLAAFEAAKFFELPTRVGRCVDCGVVTVGYRDEHRIHEVTNLGFAQMPGLESLQKSLSDAAKPLEHYVIPNAKNYQALLDAGWSPNERVGPTDETVFNYAVRSLDDESVWLLLERGARVNDRALHDAASCAAPIFVRLWKAAGLTAQSENARALLLRAAAGNCVDTVSFLLLKGIPVNAANPNTGLTPLMGAAGSDGQRAFDFLVEHGARLDTRDANGNSVLWHAAGSYSSGDMIQTLVKGGVSIDQANLDAVTPLMHAAESCKATSVKALLALGADRNLKDHQGKTAAQLIPIGHDDLADRCRATAYMFQR